MYRERAEGEHKWVGYGKRMSGDRRSDRETRDGGN